MLHVRGAWCCQAKLQRTSKSSSWQLQCMWTGIRGLTSCYGPTHAKGALHSAMHSPTCCQTIRALH